MFTSNYIIYSHETKYQRVSLTAAITKGRRNLEILCGEYIWGCLQKWRKGRSECKPEDASFQRHTGVQIWYV